VRNFRRVKFIPICQVAGVPAELYCRGSAPRCPPEESLKSPKSPSQAPPRGDVSNAKCPRGCEPRGLDGCHGCQHRNFGDKSPARH
jgi:hypothetical protein